MENVTLLHELILQKNLPQNIDSAADTKLNWLRSQVIGQDANIHTPFGKRKLTYADHTASGRCLYYIEDYIVKNVLPCDGNINIAFYLQWLLLSIVVESLTYQRLNLVYFVYQACTCG